MKNPFQLLPSADFDVVGFGTNAVDHLISVPEYPAHDSKTRLSEYIRAAGGEVASTMVGLRRLGLKTAYAGRFGDDEEGRFGLQTLIDAGVDVTCAERIRGASTQIGFIVIDARTGERTVIWHRDEKLAYTPSQAPLPFAARGRILHLTPHDTQACIEMAKTAKENGVLVSVDIDNLFDGVETLLPLVDIFTASASFPRQITGLADERAALREITSRFGCGLAGLTRGRAGSIFLCGDVFIETDGFDVPGGCVDTTGAGDAFRAGLFYGILNGAPLERSALMANAVAALKCRRFGARAGLPDVREMEVLLKNI